MNNRIFFVAACALLCTGAAFAQVTAPYTENFDAGALPAGWTVTVTSTGGGTVTWGVDATPAGVIGAGPDSATFGGSASSLNFNDGTDTEDDVDPLIPAGANVLSPTIDVTGLGGSVVVTFQCNYNTAGDGSAIFFDTRVMNVEDSSSLILSSFTFDSPFGFPTVPESTCPGPGAYHQHQFDVTGAVGATSPIQIRYSFETDSGGFGFTPGPGFEGWFIDNLLVTCSDTIPPTIPTNVLPTDGGCALVPPGVLLDWSDSTDTTPCGPGTVANYVVELDDDPAFASINFTSSPAVSNVTTPLLVPNTYYWRVRAIDGQGNPSANSTPTSFVVEAALAPLAPDTLFVNEDSDGAQSGDSGFVSPVVDLTPVFSAIFRDPNLCGNASALRFQVSDDSTFAILNFDSGVITLAPPVAKDQRCPDQTINVELSRDTIYFWRIQFTDESGLTGPFSVSQSFRTGDDFDFGVRNGSSNHSRRCFVATATFGGVTPEVAGLMGWRASVLEASAAGGGASRAYTAVGPGLASSLSSTGLAGAARSGLAPAGAAASRPIATGFACLAVLAVMGLAALRRLG